MKMNTTEALKILGIGVNVSFEDMKRSYRVLSSQYHPDRNPAGLQMMQLINAAYSALSDYDFHQSYDEQANDGTCLSEELNNALNAIIHLGLTIEICGSWIWVSGNTRPHKDVLKESGYKWAPKKLMWSFGTTKTFSRGKFSMSDIREKHGSMSIKNKSYSQINASA